MTTMENTITTLPTAEELRDRVRAALRAVGAEVDLGAATEHGLPASTPITGDVLFTLREDGPPTRGPPLPKRHRHLRRGAPPRRRCAAPWWPGSANCSPSTRPISARW